ncbi:MAG: hypothetical protein ACRYG4_23945 [Janthinobacterium lividum]
MERLLLRRTMMALDEARSRMEAVLPVVDLRQSWHAAMAARRPIRR